MDLGGGAGRAASRWGLPLPGLPDVFQSLALDDFDKPPAHGGLLAEPQSVPCATRGKRMQFDWWHGVLTSPLLLMTGLS
jgi:hypothetical protein